MKLPDKKTMIKIGVAIITPTIILIVFLAIMWGWKKYKNNKNTIVLSKNDIIEPTKLDSLNTPTQTKMIGSGNVTN